MGLHWIPWFQPTLQQLLWAQESWFASERPLRTMCDPGHRRGDMLWAQWQGLHTPKGIDRRPTWDSVSSRSQGRIFISNPTGDWK